jgi:hypothetical protein
MSISFPGTKRHQKSESLGGFEGCGASLQIMRNLVGLWGVKTPPYKVILFDPDLLVHSPAGVPVLVF